MQQKKAVLCFDNVMLVSLHVLLVWDAPLRLRTVGFSSLWLKKSRTRRLRESAVIQKHSGCVRNAAVPAVYPGTVLRKGEARAVYVALKDLHRYVITLPFI